VAPESLTLFVAFSAGLLSFLSPCVLPLVPSYLTFITGLGLEDVTRSRRTTVTHALLFVLGFSLIFVAMGAGATAFGQLMLAYRTWIARIGGVLMVLMGLWMLGVFQFGALQRERRIHLSDKPLGYLGTIVVGIAFGAGWTPCLGPTLGAILLLAATESELSKGIVMLSA
jgi:cytochrome c-type biogenesis protein